ncbi:MAG: hypothetical protein QM581_14660 [Pseudomonas sp.]
MTIPVPPPGHRGNATGLLRAGLRVALFGAVAVSMPAPVIAASRGASTPTLSIVLMRHGVRAPTKPNASLDRYSRAPWPAWSVAPGRLTAHGHAGLVALGQRYRAWLAPSLGIAAGCAGLRQIAVVADSDNRNHASAQALGQGLAPGCGLQYRALPEGRDNPLFGAADEDVPAASVQLDADARRRLEQLQALLLDCHGGDCAEVAQAQDRKLLLDPTAGDHQQAEAKALKQAGSLAENLMLEYTEGMPLAQVGWGRLDRAGVERLIALHDISFAQFKRPLPVAAANGSNLLAHLLATLQAGAGLAPTSTPRVGSRAAASHASPVATYARAPVATTTGIHAGSAIAPLADSQARLLFVIGHDTNLANLAGLLELHWQAHGVADLYPPGGGLVFDLIGQGTDAKLRIRTLLPGLDALRQNRFDGDAIASRTLPLAACDGALECPLAKVVAWLQPRLDMRHIEPTLPPMRDWPAQPTR